MKQIFPLSRIIITAFFLVLVFSLSSSYAFIRPVVTCLPVTGTPPVIDGNFNPGEWPASPQLTISSPIQSDIYCMNDSTNLFFLVDAVGDQTSDSGSSCDECLLWFGFGSGLVEAEIWTLNGGGSNLPAGSSAAIGFNTSPNDSSHSHRIYEFRIPLSSINVSPGQLIDFSSPSVNNKTCGGASMPFDGSTGNDNVWPPNLNINDQTTYGSLQLDPATQSIPTLNEWGMIIFMVIAALGSIYYMRRLKRT